MPASPSTRFVRSAAARPGTAAAGREQGEAEDERADEDRRRQANAVVLVDAVVELAQLGDRVSEPAASRAHRPHRARSARCRRWRRGPGSASSPTSSRPAKPGPIDEDRVALVVRLASALGEPDVDDVAVHAAERPPRRRGRSAGRPPPRPSSLSELRTSPVTRPASRGRGSSPGRRPGSAARRRRGRRNLPGRRASSPGTTTTWNVVACAGPAMSARNARATTAVRAMPGTLGTLAGREEWLCGVIALVVGLALVGVRPAARRSSGAPLPHGARAERRPRLGHVLVRRATTRSSPTASSTTSRPRSSATTSSLWSPSWSCRRRSSPRSPSGSGASRAPGPRAFSRSSAAARSSRGRTRTPPASPSPSARSRRSSSAGPGWPSCSPSSPPGFSPLAFLYLCLACAAAFLAARARLDRPTVVAMARGLLALGLLQGALLLVYRYEAEYPFFRLSELLGVVGLCAALRRARPARRARPRSSPSSSGCGRSARRRRTSCPSPIGENVTRLRGIVLPLALLAAALASFRPRWLAGLAITVALVYTLLPYVGAAVHRGDTRSAEASLLGARARLPGRAGRRRESGSRSSRPETTGRRTGCRAPASRSRAAGTGSSTSPRTRSSTRTPSTRPHTSRWLHNLGVRFVLLPDTQLGRVGEEREAELVRSGRAGLVEVAPRRPGDRLRGSRSEPDPHRPRRRRR